MQKLENNNDLGPIQTREPYIMSPVFLHQKVLMKYTEDGKKHQSDDENISSDSNLQTFSESTDVQNCFWFMAGQELMCLQYNLGSVVQSITSLTSSLRDQLVKCFTAL